KGGEVFRRGGVLQGVAQGLAPLAECLRDELRHQLAILDWHVVRLAGPEPDKGRGYLWRRPERGSWNVEQLFRMHAASQHDREPAVRARARGGGNAIDDLLLQHEVQVVKRTGDVRHAEEQGSGDVVREVA